MQLCFFLECEGICDSSLKVLMEFRFLKFEFCVVIHGGKRMTYCLELCGPTCFMFYLQNAIMIFYQDF